jgi:hypothetical protein
MSLRNLFSRIRTCTLYIRVHKNRFFIRHIENGSEVSRTCTDKFSTDDIIIGDYQLAEQCLSDSLEELLGSALRFLSIRAVIHQSDPTKSGLSFDDERMLEALALKVGIDYVVVWEGHPLSDDEVMDQMQDT